MRCSRASRYVFCGIRISAVIVEILMPLTGGCRIPTVKVEIPMPLTSGFRIYIIVVEILMPLTKWLFSFHHSGGNPDAT